MSALFSGLRGTIAKGAIVVGVAGFTLDQAIYTVPAGSRGILFNRFGIFAPRGIDVREKGEGMHLLIPGFQYVAQYMDVRTKPKVISTETGTRDLQTVSLSLRVLYRPVPDRVGVLYQERGVDYAARILPSFGNEVLKSVVAQYNADQLLTQREDVSRKIREEMSKQCMRFDILLDDVSITHLSFSGDFIKAIEDKQVAEQKAERAKFVVARAEQEKLALIIKSQGDAEAAKLVAEAIANHGSGLIEIRRIETALEIADTLARGRGNVTYLPDNQSILLNMPTN
eukprot:gb/GEZN01013819.1/.p1 GENE.gb/GEZN01013819.1/~~gb/GEZN01013819.1/.p1  ORF type:complete len:284 (+),score=43.38 gb/GEZN01013819.1/:85-936(+)